MSDSTGSWQPPHVPSQEQSMRMNQGTDYPGVELNGQAPARSGKSKGPLIAGALGVLSVAVIGGTLLAGIGSDEDEPQGTAPVDTAVADSNDVVVDFALWGYFGIEDLADEYSRDHDGVMVTVTNEDYYEHHEIVLAEIDGGADAPVISLIEEDYTGYALALADSLVNFNDFPIGDTRDDFLPWAWARGGNADGSVQWGIPADVAGLGLCYRNDLLEAAGMAHERDEVAALTEDWDAFIAFGQQYTEATGKPFLDSPDIMALTAIAQTAPGHVYVDRNGDVDMDSAKEGFDYVLKAIDAGIIGQEEMWTEPWEEGVTNGDFAAMLCSSWMVYNIGSYVDESGDDSVLWDLTNVPGDGGTFGSSYYSVSASATPEQQAAAVDFIVWLQEPEQQQYMYEAYGIFPSQTALFEGDFLVPYPEDYVNGAMLNEVYGDSAVAQDGANYYPPDFRDYEVEVSYRLHRVLSGDTSVATAWTWLLSDIENENGT